MGEREGGREEKAKVGNVVAIGQGRVRGKSPDEGRRDKRRQADAVTRKADVLNGIKQLSI